LPDEKMSRAATTTKAETAIMIADVEMPDFAAVAAGADAVGAAAAGASGANAPPHA